MNGKQSKIRNSFLWIVTAAIAVVIIFNIIQCPLYLPDKSFDLGRVLAAGIGPDIKSIPVASVDLQIRNSGFELKASSSADKPESWDTELGLKAGDADKQAIYAWDNVLKHSGERSVMIEKISDESSAGWVQIVPCSRAGKRYEISAWIKTEGISNDVYPPRGATISVIFINRGKMIATYQSLSVQESAGWRQESVVIVEPEDCAEMIVSLNLNCRGTAWWDDVSIREMPLLNLSEFQEITGSELDQYGGWKKIKGTPTGFFHTEKIGERWWIITPDGNGYIIKGVQYMPSGEGERVPPVSAEQRIKDWGFNTVSHYPFFKNLVHDAPASPSLWGFPWFPEKEPDIRIPLIDTDENDLISKASAFMDVFSARFRELLEKEFKITAEKYKNDPWLLGYFTGNELPWEGNPSRNISLFDMFFALPGKSEGKRTLVYFLKKRYSGDAKGFNEAWGTNIKEFNELLIIPRLRKQTQNAHCKKDKQEFVRLVADTYFRLFHETIRKYDQNHMILGTRFRDCYGTPKEVLESMGNYVDVVSFNCYALIPPLEFLTESYKINQKPILISEFSFKAEDSGLPNLFGAGQTFKTQQERALWYERYVAHSLSSPCIVGHIWYKYDDDPPRKMVENSNCGLVNNKNLPYDRFTEKVKEINRKVYWMAEKSSLARCASQ